MVCSPDNMRLGFQDTVWDVIYTCPGSGPKPLQNSGPPNASIGKGP